MYRPKPNNWSELQFSQAKQLQQAGLNHRQIGERIGKTANAVSKVLIRAGIRMNASQSAVRREEQKIKTAWSNAETEILTNAVNQQQKENPDGPIDWAKIASLLPGRTRKNCRARWSRGVNYKHLLPQISRIEVPAEVIADRERRMNEYRTLSQIMMGDPPPSRSALGRPCE